jgi:hypothetical protein
MKIRTFLALLAALLLLTISSMLAARGSARAPAKVEGQTVQVSDQSETTVAAAQQAPRTGEQINWQVIPSGSAHSTSVNYEMFATAAQTAVGTITSRGYTIKQGYWKGGSAGGPQYLCGDADGNEIVNISDAVYLIAYIFGGGPAPDPLLSGDADCNGIVNISDAVYLIAYIFGGGPAPCENCP